VPFGGVVLAAVAGDGGLGSVAGRVEVGVVGAGADAGEFAAHMAGRPRGLGLVGGAELP